MHWRFEKRYVYTIFPTLPLPHIRYFMRRNYDYDLKQYIYCTSLMKFVPIFNINKLILYFINFLFLKNKKPD